MYIASSRTVGVTLKTKNKNLKNKKREKDNVPHKGVKQNGWEMVSH